MIHYLPSCTFTARSGDASERLRDYLAGKGVHICGCCHYAQNAFRPTDTVLVACADCANVTRELSPEVAVESIYTYLLRDPQFPWPDYAGEPVVLEGSWLFGRYPQVAKDVRECLHKMNLRVVLEGDCTFEGPVRYRSPSKRKLGYAPICYGALDSAQLEKPSDGVEAEMKRRVSAYPETLKVVCYSNGSWKGIEMSGRQPVHILDLLSRDLTEVRTQEPPANNLSSVVFLPCNDVEETHRFYGELLGLPLAQDQGTAKIYDIGYGYWGFVAYGDGRPLPGGPKGVCLSLNCTSRAAVDSAYAHLLAKGAEILSPPAQHPHFDVYSFFLRDPNGYTVEYQYTAL